MPIHDSGGSCSSSSILSRAFEIRSRAKPSVQFFGTSSVLRKQAQGSRLVALLIQHFNGLAPGQLLAVIDVTKVQNMLLHHSATGNAFVLDNAPVAMLLAVFFPCLGAQEHDGR